MCQSCEQASGVSLGWCRSGPESRTNPALCVICRSLQAYYQQIGSRRSYMQCDCFQSAETPVSIKPGDSTGSAGLPEPSIASSPFGAQANLPSFDDEHNDQPGDMPGFPRPQVKAFTHITLFPLQLLFSLGNLLCPCSLKSHLACCGVCLSLCNP